MIKRKETIVLPFIASDTEPNGITFSLKTARQHKRKSEFYSLLSYFIFFAKRLSKRSYTKTYQRAGKEYGFPKCCIKDFCTVEPENRTEQQRECMTGHGFVPCARHAQMIVDGKIKIEDIIKKRKNKQKFPIE